MNPLLGEAGHHITKWYESSRGQGLSATIGGVSIVGVAEILSQVAAVLGYSTEVSAIAWTIVAAFYFVGGAMSLFGAARKAKNWFLRVVAWWTA